ncbi:unnamed protein product [Protopolystoma xenopodis]|uniref:Uncharacterized protein n=1 Tax=Protopolystoma xenopodis TaxID=117903 RepID=A0A448WZI4_9PLAT|nr:unnamed protein product [Protopolystoma xenopodis]
MHTAICLLIYLSIELSIYLSIYPRNHRAQKESVALVCADANASWSKGSSSASPHGWCLRVSNRIADIVTTYQRLIVPGQAPNPAHQHDRQARQWRFKQTELARVLRSRITGALFAAPCPNPSTNWPTGLPCHLCSGPLVPVDRQGLPNMQGVDIWRHVLPIGPCPILAGSGEESGQCEDRQPASGGWRLLRQLGPASNWAQSNGTDSAVD